MASWRPEIHTADGVLNYYDQFDSPYWNLFAGSKPEEAYLRWDFMANDKARGRQVLKDALDSIIDNPNNNNTYLLQILMEEPKEPKNGIPPGRKPRVVRKPLSKNVTFQLNATDGIQPYNQQMAGMPMYQGNSKQIEQLIQQNNEMLTMLKENLISEREEVNEKTEPQGFVGALLNNPTYQPLIEAVIMGIAAKFLPSNETPSAKHISGINDQVLPPSLQEVMERLSVHGMTYDDLVKLSQFADRAPFQFKLYLQMLRSKF